MTEPVADTRPEFLHQPTSDAGRVWVLAVMGLFAGALPLPALPTALLRRVRGAVVHEVSGRYTVTLTTDARAWLSEPSKTLSRTAFIATAVFVARRALRRLGAIGMLPPAMAWLEVYALGLLFERYLSSYRQSQTVRLDRGEALVVRAAIDRALGRVLDPDVHAARPLGNGPSEDLRDLPTRVSDGILIGVASGPSYLRRRLEAAFDRAMRESPVDVEGQRGPAHV